jgi:hypothetical protein
MAMGMCVYYYEITLIYYITSVGNHIIEFRNNTFFNMFNYILVLRLTTDYTSTPLYVFMAWCLVNETRGKLKNEKGTLCCSTDPFPLLVNILFPKGTASSASL